MRRVNAFSLFLFTARAFSLFGVLGQDTDISGGSGHVADNMRRLDTADLFDSARKCADLRGITSTDRWFPESCCPSSCAECSLVGCAKARSCCPRIISLNNHKCAHKTEPPCVADGTAAEEGRRSDWFYGSQNAKEADAPPKTRSTELRIKQNSMLPTQLWGDCTHSKLCSEENVCREIYGWAQCRPDLEACPPPALKGKFNCTIIGSSVPPPRKECYFYGYRYETKSVMQTFTSKLGPWRCHALCQITVGCQAVNYISSSDSNNNKCEMLSSLGDLIHYSQGKHQSGGSTSSSMAVPKTCGWDQLKNPIKKDTAMESWISATLSKMTLEEKLGQMVMAPLFDVSDENVLEKYSLGAILWPPGFFRDMNPKQIAVYWDKYHSAAMRKKWNSGVALPPLIAADAIHGHNNAPSSTIFPHNIGLGCANDTDLMRRIGLITATEISATGIDWTLAPTVAVASDSRWGRTYEAFGQDPFTAKALSAALLSGLQGNPKKDINNFLKGTRVLATCKHWLADGASFKGITDGDSSVSEEELRDIHSIPYRACIEDAGVQTIMPSFTSTNGVEMHGYKFLLTDVLKNTFNFDGFIVGDYNGHARRGNDPNGEDLEGCSVNYCPSGINAGLDMLMIGGDWISFIHLTASAVKEGKISETRIDDAVRRIMRVKTRVDLIGPNAAKVKKKPSLRAPYSGRNEVMSSYEHVQVAQEAVRKSLVLLKNDDHALPLSPRSKLFVVSRLISGEPYANFVPTHVGSWAMSWQADENTNSDFPHATSIYAGLKTATWETPVLSRNTDESNRAAGDYDAIVAVIGEKQYAEAKGDLKDASLLHHNRYPDDLNVLRIARKRAKNSGIPIICILICGRPLYVNQHINLCDAFVVAWLPGIAAGQGIADVLFEGRYDFHGKLSHQWPAHPCQTSMDSDDKPLFPVGYGLSMRRTPDRALGHLEESYVATC